MILVIIAFAVALLLTDVSGPLVDLLVAFAALVLCAVGAAAVGAALLG